VNLKELQEKRRAALLAARTIADEAEKAERDFSADERQKVEGYLKEARDLTGKIKEAEGDAALRKQIIELGEGLDERRNGERAPLAGSPAGRGKSLGEQFAEAQAFQAWLKSVAPSGILSEQVKGLHSPPVEFKRLFKDLLTGSDATEGGAFVQRDYTGIYEPLGRRERTMLDLIPRRTTTSDIVEFVRQTQIVQQAAPVAEANVTTPSGATGEVTGEKPEADMAFEKVTANVKTIAVWIPATKRALSDAAQLRGIIDQELRDDLQEELESQVYDGDGIGENFTGVTNTAGHLTQVWDTDVFRTTRKAKTAVTVTGHARPTAYVFNPLDWESIELTQDAQNRYYYGGPLSAGEKRLWGIPVVESECLDEGTAILADWRKAIIWDREQASIQVSDSHADFFIRNMVAILCEIRAAFGLIRPSAFCIIDLGALS